MWIATTRPMISVKLPIGESPGMNSEVCSLHSKFTGDSATRGGLHEPRGRFGESGFLEFVDVRFELAR